MYQQPTKATPGGCLIGLAGLAFLIFAGLCVWGCYLAINRGAAEEVVAAPWKFAVGALVTATVGVILIRWGWKLAIKSDMSDPSAPKKSKVRF